MLVTPTAMFMRCMRRTRAASRSGCAWKRPTLPSPSANCYSPYGKRPCKSGKAWKATCPLWLAAHRSRTIPLFITLTNSHASQGAEVILDLLGGADIGEAEGQVLTGEIHAHNTFAAPTQVTPQPFTVDSKATQLTSSCQPPQWRQLRSIYWVGTISSKKRLPSSLKGTHAR